MDGQKQKKLNRKIAKFIDKDPEKFIFHYSGPSNTGKSQAISKAIQSMDPKDMKGKIWIITGRNQANMVIEYIPRITKEFVSRGLFDKNTGENVINRCLDNTRNIQIFTSELRGLSKKIAEAQQTSERKNAYILIIDNVENILSMHLFTESWQKELVAQWKIFLKNLIELNNEQKFIFKIILISNETLLDMEDKDIKDFTISEKHEGTEQEAEREAAKARRKAKQEAGRKAKNARRKAAQENEGYKNFEVVLKSNESAKNIREDIREITDLKDKKRARELLDKITKPQKGVAGKTDYPELGSNSMEMMIFYGYTKDILKLIAVAEAENGLHDSAFRRIQEMVNDQQESGEGKDYKRDINIIRAMVSFYFLIMQLDIFNGVPEQESVHLEYYIYLLQALCTPTCKELFTDIGDLMRRYGYGSLLLEIINEIERNTQRHDQGDKIAEKYGKLLARLKVLKGNIRFYDYPEQLIGALKCYCEALELIHSKPPGCRIMAAHIRYEIFNTLYQMIRRKEHALDRQKEMRDILRGLSGYLEVKLANDLDDDFMKVFKALRKQLHEFALKLLGRCKGGRCHCNCFGKDINRKPTDADDLKCYFALNSAEGQNTNNIAYQEDINFNKTFRGLFNSANLKYAIIAQEGGIECYSSGKRLIREISFPQVTYFKRPFKMEMYASKIGRLLNKLNDHVSISPLKKRWNRYNGRIKDAFVSYGKDNDYYWIISAQYHLLELLLQQIRHSVKNYLDLKNSLAPNVNLELTPEFGELMNKLAKCTGKIKDELGINAVISMEDLEEIFGKNEGRTGNSDASNSKKMPETNRGEIKEKSWHLAKFEELLADIVRLDLALKGDGNNDKLFKVIDGYRKAAGNYARLHCYYQLRVVENKIEALDHRGA